jgi:hypothetical protein
MPEPGQRLWLENLATGPAETRAAEVRDRTVRIDAPRTGGREVPLEVGAAIALAYQAAHVPCEARTVVVPAPPGTDGGPWLRVDAIARLQRRGAVRVPVMLVARLVPDGSEDASEAQGAVTEDLSANGVLVRLTDPVRVGDRLRLVVHLGGAAGDLDAIGRVVRVDREPESARPWRAALTFPDVDRATEDRVVRFLFDRQREIRRRATGTD